MKIFVIGSINMDLVIQTNIIPKQGETVKGSSFITNSGGKGANQAVAIKNLNGNPLLIGCVGNSFGDDLILGLTKANLDISHIRKDLSVSSGVAVIILSNNDNRIILDEGANGVITTHDVDNGLKSAKKGDFLLLQLEIPISIVNYSLIKAKELGLITVLNPAPAKEIDDDKFQFIDYFIPNQSETSFYTNLYPNNKKEAIMAANILKEKGVKNVLITLGDKGAQFVGEENYYVEAVKTEVVDTTAAGDTFIGAFITNIAKKKSILYSMQYASAASSITISKTGAQNSIPKDKEVLDFLEKKKNI